VPFAPESRPPLPINAIVQIPGRPVPAPACPSNPAGWKRFVTKLIGEGILCAILKLPERGHFMPQDFLFQIC
jgi:hypothetical protein